MEESVEERLRRKLESEQTQEMDAEEQAAFRKLVASSKEEAETRALVREVRDGWEENRLLPEAEEEEPAAPLFLDAATIQRLDEEAGWRPSPDQEGALSTLLEALAQEGVYTFSGSAGSGKTTCCLALLRRLSASWDLLLLAPTWRAANRLAVVTGRETRSIHSAIYGKPTTERLCPCGAWSADLMEPTPVEVEVEEVRVKLPRYLCPSCATAHEDATRFPERLEFALREEGGGGEATPKPYRLVLVDEAGMVGKRVGADLERALLGSGTRVLAVGDPCQLGPVAGDGEDGGAWVDLTHPTAALTRVHRQAEGSPILQLAEPLKVFPPGNAPPEWPFPRRAPGVLIRSRVPLEEPAQWAARLRCEGRSVALIALSNKTRAALNALVREYTGAAAWSRQTGQPFLPGDRFLARVNSGEVRNGELWVVASWERVPEESAMLGGRGRFPRKKPNYEHDRILEGGVGVFRVSLALVGSEGRRVDGIAVAPLDGRGWPLLESGLIRGGEEPGRARDRMRRIAHAWASEYAHGIEEYQGEFERAQGEAQDRVIASARFRKAAEEKSKSGMLAELRRLWRGGGPEARERSVVIAGRVERGEAIDVEETLRVFQTPRDVALECPNVQTYCERVYGALDPERVIVLDEGEALTCHAMQGDQAEHVGIAFDGAFWGMWRNDRETGMKWGYTAETRCERELALFSIAKGS